jgi:hypothetical protein
MSDETKQKIKLTAMVVPFLFGGSYAFHALNVSKVTYVSESATVAKSSSTSARGTTLDEVAKAAPLWPARLDTAEYDKRVLSLVH